MHTVPMETIGDGDWRRWFREKGVRPTHARRWPAKDENLSSGAVRTDDGHVWGWRRQDGKVEAWPADADDVWDQPGAEEDGMLEATDAGCVRILEMPDPWEAGHPDRAACRRRDRMLGDVFG